MINKNKLLENLKIRYTGKPLVEYSFSQLSGMSDPKRKDRSKKMTAFYKGIAQGPDGNARTVWEVPSQTESATKYDSIVEIDVPTNGGLFTVAKGKWEPKKFSNILAKSDVKVWCSCPDFYWSGMKYNLGPNGKRKGAVVPNQNAGHSGAGMKEQTVVTNAPNIRDPDQNQVLCKHLLTVFSVFPANSFSIMSSAKKYDIKIKSNNKMQKDLDDGKATLAETVETVDVPKESTKELIDSLSSSAEKLGKNQEDADMSELIQDENQAKEHPDTEETEVGDIIQDENESKQPTEEPETEVGEIIDETNANAEEANGGASEIISDMNDVAESEIEDKDASDVLDTWNEMSKSIINSPK